MPLVRGSAALLLALTLCATPRGALGEDPRGAQGAWPSGWEGRWTGAASTRGPKGEGPAFTMTLDIGARAADGRRPWTLTYAGPAGEQVRRYALVAKDAARGLYAIDEGNGIVIPTAQAAADPEYRDITLAMARIWPARTDGPWLYVEQAVTQQRATPYRQRVYELLHTGGDLFESRVFSLKDPAAAVGAAEAPERLLALSPADLVPLEGCTVVLRRRARDVP